MFAEDAPPVFERLAEYAQAGQMLAASAVCSDWGFLLGAVVGAIIGAALVMVLTRFIR